MIGRRGREQSQGDIVPRNAGIIECRRAGSRCKSRQCLTSLDPTPLANAGTALDPTGIETELRFDLGVFNTPHRHRMAETGKAG